MDDGTLVYLKHELPDDRYAVDTKLRTGQIGVVTGQRGVGDWVWVTWYAGPDATEAAQAHETRELGVVKTHAPLTE